MKLLESYAINSGSKIRKPFIHTSFFPVPTQKFITFQAQTKFESKDYHYWQDVIRLINPVLVANNILIIQVGLANERLYQQVSDFRGATTVNQLAYIIERSSLHFGSDSFGVHLASVFDIPIVALYSIIQSSVAGPCFGTKEKQVLFDSYERVGNKKPSYAAKENPKSVNKINPEEIAEAILKLLGLNSKLPVETVFIGSRYSQDLIRDFIPEGGKRMAPPEQPIEIRMDLKFDEDGLAQMLSVGKCNIITNKPINLALLRHFKPHVTTVFYEITLEDSPDFAKAVRDIGIPLVIITFLNDEELRDKKINYYELGNIIKIPKDPKPELSGDLSSYFYRSNKYLFHGGEAFYCQESWRDGIKISPDQGYQPIIDRKGFWDELAYMHIIKRLDASKL